MGTIEQKAEYLRQTKALLRQALRLKGANLTLNSKFRDYVTAIDNINTELPKLNKPSVSVSDGVVHVTDNSNNGNFTTGYAIYVNGTYIYDGTSDVNLYDYIKADGTYSITAKALGDYFLASDSSDSASAVIEDAETGYSLEANTYGYTVKFKVQYSTEQNDYGTTITLED